MVVLKVNEATFKVMYFTYTSAGHWIRLEKDLNLNSKLSEISTACVHVYPKTGVKDANITRWEAKYYYYAPRAQQFGLKTSVGITTFPFLYIKVFEIFFGSGYYFGIHVSKC